MPVRVAFVSHHPHLRMGGQRSMALLIEHLDRRRVEPLVICPGPGDLTDRMLALDCPVAHIPLHRIKPRTLPAVWRSSRRIRALLATRRIAIIAPDAARDALTSGLAKLGTATKLVWFVRLTSADPLDFILERMADGMIGDSDATRRRFSPGRRVSARYRTILGGVDLGLFRPAADRPALRHALALPRDRMVLVFVGQVKRAKGVLDIVDALALLRPQLPSERLPVLVIIGTPDPPAILQDIAGRGAAAGVADAVRVLPHQPSAREWMQAADVLVSGSHQDTEGMSRVLYEAMACGAVPVATDIHGNRDALTPDTGVLVPERSPSAMAAALRALLEQPERLAALREQGVRRAREVFDIRRHARQVEEFYEQLVERGGMRVVGGPRDD